MKKKILPAWLKNPTAIKFFQSRPGRIVSNWVLQGMLYMNVIEIAYKLALDMFLTLLLVFCIYDDINLFNVLVSFLIAHTVNWIINCQPVALLMHIDVGKGNAKYFINYVKALEKRIVKKQYLLGAAAYGSLSLGRYSPTSDIDIRVIVEPDFWSKLRAANFCFIERFRAFFALFPLDLYVFTLDEVQVKMHPKEPPILFYDPSGIIKETYGEVIDFDQFLTNFSGNLISGIEK